MKHERIRALAAPVATVLSLVACYGTLAAIGLLGALGISIALDEAVWAGAILVFAWLALLALLLRQRRHGRPWPIVLAAIGVVLITFTMTMTYERAIEFAGFAFLCAGTFMDWRAARGQRRPLD